MLDVFFKVNRRMYVTILIILITAIFYNYSEYNKVEKLLAESQMIIAEQEANYVKTVRELKLEVTKLNNQIKYNETLITKYQELDKMISFSSFPKEKIEKATKISEGTPLDMKTSLVLLAYSEKYNIRPSLILGLIDLESNFVYDEVGADQDRGLMQIIPGTEKWLIEEYGDEMDLEYNPDMIFEPEYNLAIGIKYLSILKKNHGQNYHRILSEYNRGPYNLKEYYLENNTYVTSYSTAVLAREKKYKKFN